MDRRVDARTQAHVLKALVNRNPSHNILINKNFTSVAKIYKH